MSFNTYATSGKKDWKDYGYSERLIFTLFRCLAWSPADRINPTDLLQQTTVVLKLYETVESASKTSIYLQPLKREPHSHN